MLVRARSSFFPVGQGTFAGGAIELQPSKFRTFQWVYDCGCEKNRQPQLAAEIDRLSTISANSLPNCLPHLDLVFVSHFDIDHISGLVELLAKFEVDTLVLPLIPLWKRLVLAVTSKSFASTQLQAFLVNPIAFIAGLDSARIRRICLVPPSTQTNGDGDRIDDPVRPDEPIGEESLNPTETIDLRLASFNGGQPINTGPLPFSLMVLAPGAALRFRTVWEFVPYNEPALSIKASATFKAAATRVASALLQALPSRRSKILARLKATYERTYTNAKQRNKISLFVYAGPIGQRQLSAAGSSCFSSALSQPIDEWHIPCFSGQCFACATRDPVGTKTGTLYTGDGYLNTAKALHELSTYLGIRRMANLRVFQVMHHGSRYNWHRGIAAKVSPYSSVYCADPKYKYKHPHKDVQNDFSAYRPQLVNDKLGYTCFLELS